MTTGTRLKAGERTLVAQIANEDQLPGHRPRRTARAVLSSLMMFVNQTQVKTQSGQPP